MLLATLLQINLIPICNFVNIIMVNWSIYLVKNFYILIFLQISLIWGIKNEGLEVIETPPNPSQIPPPPSLKNFQTR